MEKKEQKACCIRKNMDVIGWWYINYETGFNVKLIKCRICKAIFNDSNMSNSIILNGYPFIKGATVIYENFSIKKIEDGIELEPITKSPNLEI